MRVRTALGIILALGVFFAFSPSLALAKWDSLLQKVGVVKLPDVPLPDFKLKDLDGNLVSIHDFRGKIVNSRGKVVFLNLWATWCPYCQKEHPLLEALYQAFKDRGFVIVGVSIDKEGAAAVRPYIKKYGITFPQLLDPTMDVAGGMFGLRGTPTNFLINRQGKVVAGVIGYRDWGSEDARKIIESLLNE